MVKFSLYIVLLYVAFGGAYAGVNKGELIPSPRWLYALPGDNYEVILSWRDDGEAHPLGYNVYRRSVSEDEYKKINKVLINTSCYIDKGLKSGETYCYVVRAVNNSGKESNNSDEAKVKASAKGSNIVLTIDHYGGDIHFGDLNNDGNIDYLFSKWDEYKKAYDHKGSLMWEKYLHSPDGPLHYRIIEWDPTPTVIWDIDQDGQNEVICQYYISGEYYLAILDGATGSIKKKVKMAKRFHKLAIANFRGRDVAQDILINIGEDHGHQLRAYTDNLTLLWKWNSKNPNLEVAHYPQPGDIDDDGKDEVVLGRIVLEHDGGVKYRINPGPTVTHADSIVIDEIISSSPGKEIVIGWQGPLIGLYQGPTGKVIWEKNNYVNSHSHVHRVKVAEILKDNLGKEILFTERSKLPHKIILVDAESGNLIWKKGGVTVKEATLIDWLGGETKEILGDYFIVDGHGNNMHSRKGEPTVSYSGFVRRGLENLFVCDAIGDYREEYLVGDGSKVYVYTNANHNSKRKSSPWRDPQYRKEIANWNLY